MIRDYNDPHVSTDRVLDRDLLDYPFTPPTMGSPIIATVVMKPFVDPYLLTLTELQDPREGLPLLRTRLRPSYLSSSPSCKVTLLCHISFDPSDFVVRLTHVHRRFFNDSSLTFLSLSSLPSNSTSNVV